MYTVHSHSKLESSYRYLHVQLCVCTGHMMVDLTSLGVAGSSVRPNVCVPVGPGFKGKEVSLRRRPVDTAAAELGSNTRGNASFWNAVIFPTSSGSGP